VEQLAVSQLLAILALIVEMMLLDAGDSRWS
jgi:hypothetical protein